MTLTLDTLERRKLRVAVDIRYMMHKDMEAVVEIEKTSFSGDTWDMEDFDYALASANATGIVATIADKIVGFMVYKSTPKGYEVIDMAVHTSHMKNGIGTQLIASLMRKLQACGRYFILYSTLAQNAGSQAFMEKVGFTKQGKPNKDQLVTYKYRLPPLRNEEQKQFLEHVGAVC